MDRGIVTFSDNAVKQIAVNMIMSCDGVAEMTDKTRTSEVSRTIIGQGDTAGVYVKNTREGVVLDVYFACKYGVNPTELATDAENKVKNAYGNTGITISKVNVHINSVK